MKTEKKRLPHSFDNYEVSSNSLLIEDIQKAMEDFVVNEAAPYIDHLGQLVPFKSFCKRYKDHVYWQEPEKARTNVERTMTKLLIEMSPEGFTFKPSPDDLSCFGFFPDEANCKL